MNQYRATTNLLLMLVRGCTEAAWPALVDYHLRTEHSSPLLRWYISRAFHGVGEWWSVQTFRLSRRHLVKALWRQDAGSSHQPMTSAHTYNTVMYHPKVMFSIIDVKRKILHAIGRTNWHQQVEVSATIMLELRVSRFAAGLFSQPKWLGTFYWLKPTAQI